MTARTGRSWRIDLPHTRPLSLNDRGHWRAKADKVSGVRDAAHLLARRAGVPALAAITVELHYAPRDSRRRDPENLVATLKPLVDGLVDAGVIPDDCPPFYETTVPVVDAPTGTTGRLYAVIHELDRAVETLTPTGDLL